MTQAGENLNLSLREIKTMPIFAGMTEGEIGKILLMVEELEVSTGQIIFDEGEPGDTFYIVLEGKVNIAKDDKAGNPTVLIRLEHQAVFGEMTWLTGEPRAAAAVATEPTKLIAVPRHGIETLAGQDPGLSYKLAMNIGRVLSHKVIRMNAELMRVVKPHQDTYVPDQAELAKLKDRLLNDWCF